MSRKQYILLAVIALIGGMIGGIVSTHLLPSKIAFAQKEGETTKIHEQILAKSIMVEDFALVQKLIDKPKNGDTLGLRVRLFIDQTGRPKLIMQDNNSSVRFAVTVDNKQGARIELWDKSGLKAILSENGPYGLGPLGPMLALLDNNGDIRAQIGLRFDNNPFVSLSDALKVDKGKGGFGRNIALSFMEKDEVSIRLSDAEGNTRAVLGSETTETIRTGSITKKPPSSLTLYNKMGMAIWSAP